MKISEKIFLSFENFAKKFSINFHGESAKKYFSRLCAHHLRKIFHEVSHERAKFRAECARFSAEGAEKFFNFGTKLRKFFLVSRRRREEIFLVSRRRREKIFLIFMCRKFFLPISRGDKRQKTGSELGAQDRRQVFGHFNRPVLNYVLLFSCIIFLEYILKSTPNPNPNSDQDWDLDLDLDEDNFLREREIVNCLEVPLQDLTNEWEEKIKVKKNQDDCECFGGV